MNVKVNSGSMIELGNALIDADMMGKQDFSYKLMIEDFKHKMWFSRHTAEPHFMLEVINH